MLSVSACGGGESGSSDHGVTKSTVLKLTNDAERVRYALLPREAIPAKVKRQKDLRNRATCSPRVLFKDDATVMATTPRFIIEGGIVQQTVALFRDDRAAERAFARLDSPSNRRCIVQYTHDEIVARSPEPVPSLMNQIINVEALGQQSTAYRLYDTVASETVGTDILLNRVRRGISSVSVFWRTIPQDLKFQEELLANIAMRLQRALPATPSRRHSNPM